MTTFHSRSASQKAGLDLGPAGEASVVENVAEARDRRRPGRWILAAIVAVAAVQLVSFAVTNDNLQWGQVRHYLFDKQVLDGLVTTIKIWAIVVMLSAVFGALVCALKMTEFVLARWVATAYIAVFLAIPPLVQLIFWFNLGYLLPKLSIGIPLGPSIMSWKTNTIVTPLVTAILGLTIVESAYMAEIIRGGLISVPAGQVDAAKAVGFGARTSYFRVILPQALRAILPTWGTKLISALKATSLVSIIGQTDLLRSVQNIYNINYETIPLLLVATIWYVLMVTVLTLIRDGLERRFSRGYRASQVSQSRKGASLAKVGSG